jgi:phenylacetate-CoA ligase
MIKKYWDEEIETMPPSGVARLESALLSKQISYLFKQSPFYAAKLNQAGIRPELIKNRDDLRRIPFLEKAELAESQKDGSLIGINQCAPLDKIVRIQATGGTSGEPMRIGMTRNDIADYNEMGARAFWASGCRPGDIVFECFNYNLYAGGVADHMALETLGAATIPYGVGNSKRLLDMLRHMKDEACLYSTPSYAIRLAEVAAENGINPIDVGFSKGFFSGEAGMQIPGYRHRVESLWGLKSSDIYGTGELGLHCGECEFRQGFHYGATGFVLVEMIHPETAEVMELLDAAVGEFVYTSIQREASPLLRMRSHDLMQVFTEPCPCGRTGFRFKFLGRTDDMFKVKGVNVFPLGVQAVITKLQPRLTGEIRILLDAPPPIDYSPRVQVEVGRMVPQAAYPALVAEATELVARVCNFTAAIELIPQGRISSEKKTRRLYRCYEGDNPT